MDRAVAALHVRVRLPMPESQRPHVVWVNQEGGRNVDRSAEGPRPTAPTVVVHITTVHAGSDNRIYYKECCSLAAAGYRVVLIAPSAPPAVRDDITYVALPSFRWRLARMTIGSWYAFRRAGATLGDVYHLHDPELLPVGLALKLLGRRVVYDVHEDVPAQILGKGWIPSSIRPIVAFVARAVEKLAVWLVDGVIVAGEDIWNSLGRRDAVVVANYPILCEFAERPEIPFGDRHAELVHLGGLSRLRATRELVAAMELVPSELDARLVLVGRFSSDGVEHEVQALAGWRRTQHVGWLPRPQAMAALRTARVGVVLYVPAPNHFGLRSNRAFEYMAAGLPIIGPDMPAWRDLIAFARCGLLVDPTRPEAIAAAITALLRNPAMAEEMGRAGRRAVEDRYSWEVEARVLVGLYGRLLGRVPVGGPATIMHATGATPPSAGSEGRQR